jgi:hypothetical protein
MDANQYLPFALSDSRAFAGDKLPQKTALTRLPNFCYAMGLQRLFT